MTLLRGLMAVSLLASPVLAGPSPILTWADCVALAAQHNPDLQSAARAMQASRLQYKGSWNGVLPSLSLSHAYTKSSADHAEFTSGTETWQAQGTASLNLIDAGQWAAIQSAGAAFRQSAANLQVSSSNALLNLYKAFASGLYAQEEILVTRDIRNVWKSNADMIALRYDSGTESKGNRMQTEAQLFQADSDVAQAARDLRIAQQSLSQALGQDRFQAYVVTGTWTISSLPGERPDFDALIETLPRIVVQTAVVDQARAAVRSAQASVWPVVSVNYTRGLQGSSEFPSDPFWSFTGLLSYPLLASGLTATYFADAAASQSLQKARLDLQSLRLQARTDLESAWNGYAQAQDQVRVQQAFLDAAMQRRRESDVRYESGLMPFEQWQLVVIDYVNSAKSLLRARQNLILAEAQWRFAAGAQLGDSR